MSKEMSKGFYVEFKRTPQEQSQVELKRKVKELEERVEKLEKIVLKNWGDLND